MDWLTFTSTMTGNLAWPLVVIITILLFRASIKARLPYLKKLSWGDKSAEFSDRLGEAAEKAVQLTPLDEIRALPAPQEEEGDGVTGEQQFTNTLQASPHLAILQAWLPIEQELQHLARVKGYSADRTRSPTYTIRQLQSDGTISRDTADLLKDLMGLRNIAAHGSPSSDITVDQAKEYRSIAEVVMEKLRKTNA